MDKAELSKSEANYAPLTHYHLTHRNKSMGFNLVYILNIFLLLFWSDSSL